MRTRPGLDAIDIRILAAVQQHGQLSKTRLAEIVNLSPTPCLERLTRLRAAGYIRGYHADIALERIVDVTRVVVTVALGRHRKADFDRFEARLRATPEVTGCVATGGGSDYILTVVCTGLAAFQALMDALLAEDLGIERYTTYIVTRDVLSRPPDLQRLTGRAGG